MSLVAANAGRLKQLEQQLVYSLALEDGLEDAGPGTPAHVVGNPAAGGRAPGAAKSGCSSPSSAAADADLLLSKALRLASAQDVGSRLRSLQVAERQQLLRYLQGLALSVQQQPAVAAAQGTRPTSAPGSAVRRKAAGDAVCAACERAAAAAASWTCSGACCRVFHTACLAAPVTRRCSECTSNKCALIRIPAFNVQSATFVWAILRLMCTPAWCSHPCFHCNGRGQSDAVVKCSMGRCGRYYHTRCLRSLPLTAFGKSGTTFKCALHYCALCGVSGSSKLMMQCCRCPCAYHVTCKPRDARVLSKNLLVCPRHTTQRFLDPLPPY